MAAEVSFFATPQNHSEVGDDLVESRATAESTGCGEPSAPMEIFFYIGIALFFVLFGPWILAVASEYSPQ